MKSQRDSLGFCQQLLTSQEAHICALEDPDKDSV
jgi:hypothetical protein